MALEPCSTLNVVGAVFHWYDAVTVYVPMAESTFSTAVAFQVPEDVGVDCPRLQIDPSGLLIETETSLPAATGDAVPVIVIVSEAVYVSLSVANVKVI